MQSAPITQLPPHRRGGESLRLIFLLKLVNILAATTFASRIWPRRLGGRPDEVIRKAEGETKRTRKVTPAKRKESGTRKLGTHPAARLGFLRVNRTHVARNILSWVSTPRELRYRSPSSIVPFPLFSSRKVQQRSNDVALRCNCIKGLSN